MPTTKSLHVDPAGPPLSIEIANGNLNDGEFGYALFLSGGTAPAETSGTSPLKIPATKKTLVVPLQTLAKDLDGATLRIWGTIGLAKAKDPYNTTFRILQGSTPKGPTVLDTLTHPDDSDVVSGTVVDVSNDVGLTTQSAPVVDASVTKQMRTTWKLQSPVHRAATAKAARKK